MKNVLIQTDNIVKSFTTEYGTQYILNGISVDIYEGDFTVIMGASGSGKSTLLYCLSGMDTVNGGRISFLNNEITAMSSDRLARFRGEHCGFVFQQNCLVEGLTVMDNVLVSGFLFNSRRKKVVEKAKQLFKEVDVSEVTQSKYPSQISGGRAQRVGIVRALINSPEVLFADEPTGSLNSGAGKKVLDTFNDFNRSGQSIIMVTHDVRAACRGNRILYLKDGKILGECSLSRYEVDSPERTQKVNEFLNSMEW